MKHIEPMTVQATVYVCMYMYIGLYFFLHSATNTDYKLCIKKLALVATALNLPLPVGTLDCSSSQQKATVVGKLSVFSPQHHIFASLHLHLVAKTLEDKQSRTLKGHKVIKDVLDLH